MEHGPLAHGDPLTAGIRNPDSRLEVYSTGAITAHALGFMQELAARVRRYCENPDIPDELKTQAGQLLVNLARDTTVNLQTLMAVFPHPFEEVAQKASMFPCLLPAHPEAREAMESYMLQEVGLGKLHPLKITSRRKTFSLETAANQFLLYYIRKIKTTVAATLSARIQLLAGVADYPETPLEHLENDVPLTVANAKQWMESIWSLLLFDIPEPEKHPRLKHLGEYRGTRGEDRRGKVNAGTAASNIRAGIKNSMGKYLVRMLRNSA